MNTRAGTAESQHAKSSASDKTTLTRLLIRQLTSYSFARGIPAGINFLAFTLYANLLTPEAFGEYSLTISGLSLLSTVGFYWLDIGLFRFYPERLDPSTLLATIFKSFLFSCLIFGPIGFLFLLSPDVQLPTVVLGVGILCCQAWHNLQLQLARCQLNPKRYAWLSVKRSVQAPVLAYVFIYLGFEAKGVLLGLLLSNLLPAFGYYKTSWKGALANPPDKPLLFEILSYGAPLAALFLFRFIINFSDRFVIASIMSLREVGIYAAAYDLAGHTIVFLAGIVQLGGYPVILRAFENEGLRHAQQAYNQNLSILLALLTPATAGIIILGRPLLDVFFPPDYVQAGSLIIPWLAVGTFFAVLKGSGFDVAFHLTKKTQIQLGVIIASSLINLGLNYLWIPKHGLVGAGMAAVASQASAVALSLFFARRIIYLPFPWADSFRILGATLIMTVTLKLLPPATGTLAFSLHTGVGILSYSTAAIILKLQPFITLANSFRKRASRLHRGIG